MADYITYLENLILREKELRLAFEEYCSLLKAQVYSLSIQLQQEQLNNMSLRHMVPLPVFELDPLAAEFQPGPSYAQVEDLALEPGERDERVSSTPRLEGTQNELQEEESNTQGRDTQGSGEQGSGEGETATRKIEDGPDSAWIREVLHRSETM